MVINSSQNLEYESAESAGKSMEALETSWDALSVSDLFGLQSFVRTAAENMPESRTILLRLRGDGRSRSEARIWSNEEVECFFVTRHLSAVVRTFNEGKVAGVVIRLWLKGAPAQQDGQVLSARQQIIRMDETIALKLIPRVEGAVFGDANDLARVVADEVHSAKPDLAQDLVVRSLIVEAEVQLLEVPTPSDQDGTAAMDMRQELEHSVDESDGHDPDFRSTALVEMTTSGDASAHKDPRIEGVPSTAPGGTQAATLKDLMRELDAELSSPSPPLSVQATSARPPTSPIDATTPPRRKMERGVVVALGSNVGNRIEEIEKACRAIDADPDMRIVDTSFLYETKPMYVEDQERFVNGACEVSEQYGL